MKISKVKDRNLYYCNVRKPDGKYRKVYGKTKKEVREKANSLAFDIRDGKFVESNTITVAEWLKEWSDNYLINLSDNSKLSYKSIIKIHLIPNFGNKKIQKLTHNEIQTFINRLSQKRTPKTVYNVFVVLHRALKDAINNGYIVINPADNIILPKINKQTMCVLDQNEVTQFLLLAYQQEPEYADIMEFLILTGLRVGELVGLTIDCYNREKKSILINKQFPQKLCKFTEPKYGEIREVYLIDRAVEIIEKRIEIIERIRKKNKNFNKENFIFLNRLFKHVQSNTLLRSLKRIAKQIGKPNLRIHDLRHTYATLSLAYGNDIKTVQTNLGHTDPSFTMNKYAHSTDIMKINSVNQFEEMYTEISTKLTQEGF